MGFYKKRCNHPLVAYREGDPKKGRISVTSAVYDIGMDIAIGTAYGYAAARLNEWEPDGRFLGLIKEYVEHKLRNQRNARIGEEWERIEGKIAKAFPLVGVHHDYGKGSSGIEVLYTAELNGYEFAIHAVKEGEQAPSQEILVNRARNLKSERKSPYQEKGAIMPLYRDGFSDPGAPHLTLEDFPIVTPDPTMLYSWFVRDEMWTIQQFGKELEFDNGQTEIDVDGLKVRKYGRPKARSIWFSWEVINLLYKSFDPAYRLGKYFGSEKDKDRNKNPITQYLFEQQYKSVTRAYRALRKNPKRKPFVFDLTKAEPIRNSAPRALSRRLRKSELELYSLN